MLLVCLLVCTELFISAPKIITFLPNPPLECEKVPLESNPIPYPAFINICIYQYQHFFLKVTASNKQFSKVALELVTNT